MWVNHDRDFIKEFIILALPVAFQQLVTQILLMIDNIMIGHLGEICISTVSICNTFIWLSTTIITGLLAGAVIVCVQEHGRGNKEQIYKIFSLMLVLNILFSLVFYIGMSLFPSFILSLYTNVPEIIDAGVDYFKITKYSLIFNAIYLTIIYTLNSIRNVKISLYVSIFSCLSKIFINWVFIYGNLGFESLGIKGAAISTLLVRFIECLLATCYFFMMEEDLKFRIKDFNFKLEKEAFIMLINVSLPTLFLEISNNLLSSAQTMITGHISEYYISANSIVHSAWMLPSVIYSGLSVAASIMIGNKIGKGDKKEAQKYALNYIPTTLIVSLFCAISLQFILPIIMKYYNVSATTLDLAKRMGYFASITSFFMGFRQVLANGVIKSLGKTRKLMRLDIVSNWLFAVPFGYLAAFIFNWPVEYLYLILRSGSIIITFWSLYEIKTGKWLKIEK